MGGGCSDYIEENPSFLYYSFHLPLIGEGELSFIMGECIMTSRGQFIEWNGSGGNNQLNNINVNSGYAGILCTLLSSDGDPVSNISINCNDGGTWYNYLTNDIGQAYFEVNSGGATFSVTNQSSAGWRIVDQVPPEMKSITNINIGDKMNIELQYTYIGPSNMVILNNSSLRFLATKTATVKILGAGGGGADGDVGLTGSNYGGGGGGGGAYNGGTISIDKSTIYNIIIGKAGADTSGKNGKTGGTTSAFGLSAVGGRGGSYTGLGGTGGGSGSYKGGDGGSYSNPNGKNPAYSIYYSGYLGGGGGAAGKYAYAPLYYSGQLVYMYSFSSNSYAAEYTGTLINPGYGTSGGGDGSGEVQKYTDAYRYYGENRTLVRLSYNYVNSRPYRFRAEYGSGGGGGARLVTELASFDSRGSYMYELAASSGMGGDGICIINF